MIRITLFILSIAFSFQAAAADYVKNCGAFAAPLPGGYCIFKPTAHASRDVIYYLHGRGGDLDQFLDDHYYTGQIRKEWKQRHERLPTIIAVTFGPDWLLAEKNASPYSGLFDAFTKQVMPNLEAAIGFKHGRRLVFGESMGGFNTIQLALKTRLFDKAAALCAPMAEVSAFASDAEIEAYVKTTHAYDYWLAKDPNEVMNNVKSALTLVRAVYPTPADWEKGNPLALAASTRSRTQMYLAAGMHDVYALYEGNEKFAEIFKGRGKRIEWRAQWGGHCAMDIPSLARFLTN